MSNPPLSARNATDVTNPSQRVLLLGKDGQLGHALNRALRALGEVTAVGRHQLDLALLVEQAASQNALTRLIEQSQPDIIVNAMAYTAVDRAEQEPTTALAVNALAPGLLAQAAQDHGACLVHYSTDYVFDGKRSRPYTEEDSTHPLSVYGHSKREGEINVARACERHMILRTSWVYGAYGQNFLKTMLRLALERPALKIVNDQYGAPTGVDLLAQVTVQILQQSLQIPTAEPTAQPIPQSHPWGLYHVSAAGVTNWYDYAQFVIQSARERGWPIKPQPQDIQGIASSQYPVAATRPQYSLLDTSRIRQTFGLSLPDWKVGVADVVKSLRATDINPVSP